MTLIDRLTAIDSAALFSTVHTSKTWIELKQRLNLETSNTALKKALTRFNVDYTHITAGQLSTRSQVWSINETVFRDAVTSSTQWSEVMHKLNFADNKLLFLVKERIRKLGMNAGNLKNAPRPDFEPILALSKETLQNALISKDPTLKRTPETWREICGVLGYPAAAKPVLMTALDKHGIGYSHVNVKKLPSPHEAFTMHSKVLRPVLLKLLLDGREHKCDCCKLTEWLGGEIPLRLIYKNNDTRDAREENLSLVCANCAPFCKPLFNKK